MWSSSASPQMLRVGDIARSHLINGRVRGRVRDVIRPEVVDVVLAHLGLRLWRARQADWQNERLPLAKGVGEARGLLDRLERPQTILPAPAGEPGRPSNVGVRRWSGA